MTDTLRPGTYVEFRRRRSEYPYWQKCYGIITGASKSGVRIRALRDAETGEFFKYTSKRHLIAIKHVLSVSFEQVHAK